MEGFALITKVKHCPGREGVHAQQHASWKTRARTPQTLELQDSPSTTAGPPSRFDAATAPSASRDWLLKSQTLIHSSRNC
jgi:hypothetical protein